LPHELDAAHPELRDPNGGRCASKLRTVSDGRRSVSSRASCRR
jgi:hypothetical protein